MARAQQRAAVRILLTRPMTTAGPTKKLAPSRIGTVIGQATRQATQAPKATRRWYR